MRPRSRRAASFLAFTASAWRIDWTGADGETFDSCYTLSPEGVVGFKKGASGTSGTGMASATIGSRTVTLPLKTYPLSRSLSYAASPASYVLYPGAAIPQNVTLTITYADGTSRRFDTFADPEIGVARFRTLKDASGIDPFSSGDKPFLSEGNLLAVPEEAVCALSGEAPAVRIGVDLGLKGAGSYSQYAPQTYFWCDGKPELVTVGLSSENGEAKLDYRRKDGRIYVEEGRRSLTEGDWHVREAGDRFFRVSVSLPPEGE